MTWDKESSPLGIIAGGGGLPLELIHHCRHASIPHRVYGFVGQTDTSFEGQPRLREVCDGIPKDRWFRLGEIARFLKILRLDGVDRVVMVGRFARPSLGDMRPDLGTARLLAQYGARLLGDDAALRVVAEILEKNGQRVIGVEDILGGALLAQRGPMGRLLPNDVARQDMARGLAVAKALGQVDVGQSVVVQQGIVLGVEAAEGTDRLMARCADLRQSGQGGVLIKVIKPGQDNRFDRPVVGPSTVEGALRSGLCGIAVEAGAVLTLDRPSMVRRADEGGLFLWGIEGGDTP